MIDTDSKLISVGGKLAEDNETHFYIENTQASTLSMYNKKYYKYYDGTDDKIIPMLNRNLGAGSNFPRHPYDRDWDTFE